MILAHFTDLHSDSESLRMVSWLVVFRHPSEKYEFVNWDDDRNPILMGKCQKWQPNHQPVSVAEVAIGAMLSIWSLFHHLQKRICFSSILAWTHLWGTLHQHIRPRPWHSFSHARTMMNYAWMTHEWVLTWRVKVSMGLNLLNPTANPANPLAFQVGWAFRRHLSIQRRNPWKNSGCIMEPPRPRPSAGGEMRSGNALAMCRQCQVTYACRNICKRCYNMLQHVTAGRVAV